MRMLRLELCYVSIAPLFAFEVPYFVPSADDKFYPVPERDALGDCRSYRKCLFMICVCCFLIDVTCRSLRFLICKPRTFCRAPTINSIPVWTGIHSGICSAIASVLYTRAVFFDLCHVSMVPFSDLEVPFAPSADDEIIFRSGPGWNRGWPQLSQVF